MQDYKGLYGLDVASLDAVFWENAKSKNHDPRPRRETRVHRAVKPGEEINPEETKVGKLTCLTQSEVNIGTWGSTADYPHIGSTVQKLPAQTQHFGKARISSTEQNT